MVLLLGVGIASVTDLQLNLLGSIIAVLTIAATCVGQIVSLCLLFSHELRRSAAQASCWILQSFMHPAYAASTCWPVILNLGVEQS
jgi:hypothetical protein